MYHLFHYKYRIIINHSNALCNGAKGFSPKRGGGIDNFLWSQYRLKTFKINRHTICVAYRQVICGNCNGSI